MSTATLTSLAMLKVNIDHNKDYLEYIRPFILQVLVDHKPDPVTDSVIQELLREQFGLAIPARTIQIVLKRISRKSMLRREDYVYHITNKLQSPDIHIWKSDADRHINAIVSGLIDFSHTIQKPLSGSEEAIEAICSFLENFDISCLRAYLRGTAIPSDGVVGRSILVLVSKYLVHLQSTDPERFESFMVIVTGHMLANALLCPDLQNAPKTYKNVTFYLDTPLILQRLGLEGESKRLAEEELLTLLKNLGGRIAIFDHTQDELRRVLTGAADHLDSPDGRGPTVMEARRRGTTKSDLLLLSEQIAYKCSEIGIDVLPTPRYINKFQIGEEEFEEALGNELSYLNPHAIQYDINSVRSIYVLREGKMPHYLEKSIAVLITSNVAFAKAAWEYGKIYNESKEVSSVVTDFSLANMAWLKAPVGAPSIPRIEVLAFSYAALQPTNSLMDKYLTEIDKLQKRGTITIRDHQLLRSNIRVYDELVDLTLGDESELTQEVITETLQRVSNEIRKEESEKLYDEEIAHRKTQEELKESRDQQERIQERIYWKCHKQASIYSNIVIVIIGLLMLIDVASGIILTLNESVILSVVLYGIAISVGISLLISRWFGYSGKDTYERMRKWFLSVLIRRRTRELGIDISEFNIS